MTEITLTERVQAEPVPFGPSLTRALEDLDAYRNFDPEEDTAERNMTVQFNLYQHAQLERIAEHFGPSKTSVASDLLKATIGDVYCSLGFTELTPFDLRDFIERTAKKKETPA